MTTETVEQPTTTAQELGDNTDASKAVTDATTQEHENIDNSATDSDDDSAPENDEQNAELQQSHNQVRL